MHAVYGKKSTVQYYITTYLVVIHSNETAAVDTRPYRENAWSSHTVLTLLATEVAGGLFSLFPISIMVAL